MSESTRDVLVVPHVHRPEARDAAATTARLLRDAGVRAIFGPGTNIPQAAREILDMIRAAMADAA